MGYLLFALFVLCELYYIIQSIKTKESDGKLKQYLHLGYSFVFFLLSVTGIVRFGFQYYILTITLILWSILAILHIIRKKYPTKPIRNGRFLTKEVFLLLGIFFLFVPSILFPQYKPLTPTGSYKVSTKSFTYTDTNRIDPYSKDGSHRFVNVQFWYPKEVKDTTCPLILFSHGTYGIRTSNESTYCDLASNGYVVCSIDHPHHSLFTKSQNGSITIVDPSVIKLSQDLNAGIFTMEEQIQKENEITMIRVQDFSFVLDTIKELSCDVDSDHLYHIIDCSRIGVFGHSLGGAAAIELAREREDIHAVINLDGDMLCEYLGAKDGQLVINKDIYPRPLLNIWSDTMTQRMDESLSKDLFPQEYIAQTAPIEYDLHIKDTNHFSLTDLPLFSPFLSHLILKSVSADCPTGNARQTLIQVNQIILDFFNAYVKEDGTFSYDPALDYSANIGVER